MMGFNDWGRFQCNGTDQRVGSTASGSIGGRGMNMQDVEPIEVKVYDRASMDHCITAAVDRMIESARRQRTHGVLVTRLGDGHFVIGLSNAVPFGFTEQLDLRRQTS